MAGGVKRVRSDREATGVETVTNEHFDKGHGLTVSGAVGLVSVAGSPQLRKVVRNAVREGRITGSVRIFPCECAQGERLGAEKLCVAGGNR